MAYRGEDLDLRTPQTSAAHEVASDILMTQQRSSRRDLPAQRTSPIWVDDTLMDCCNHAYEVALAHRSAEVRVEHLIFAMTRLDASSDAMEHAGIRVAALRREMANVISTEIPIGLYNGKMTPRRSEAMEEVLRVAAQNAYRRQTAASVEDVLAIFIDPNVELPSALRLRAHLQRPAPQTSILDQPPEPPRDRQRPPFYTSEPPRGLSELSSLSSAPPPPSYSNGPQSYGQGARLDVVEQSIRNLSSELSNERKIISGALHDLQREVMAQREETSRLSGLSPDKLQGFLADRLQGLEQGLVSTRTSTISDISIVQEKIAKLERTLLSELSAARTTLSELSSRWTAGGGSVDLGAITDRLDVIEEAVLSRDIADRIKSLESSLAYERDRATAADNAFNSSLQAITTTLERQPGEVSSYVQNALTERLNGLSYALENHAISTSNALLETKTTQSSFISAVDSHITRSQQFEQQSAQEFTSLHDTLDKLGGALNDELTTLHDALGKLNANQHTLAATLETQGRDAAAALSLLATRIESLERASSKPLSMLEQLTGTTSKMHRLMVEKYFRRNRFWYWLFGTDDWLSASWPSQSRRIAEEINALRRP